MYVCKGTELLKVLDVTLVLLSAIWLDVLLPSLLDTTNGEVGTGEDDVNSGAGEIADHNTNCQILFFTLIFINMLFIANLHINYE